MSTENQAKPIVRQMQLTDLPVVAEIEHLTQSHPWTTKQLQESIENHRCTVQTLNDIVVGFCILQPVLDEANLLLMATHPKYQGQGLGFDLLTTSIKWLGDGCFMVFLEVRESNNAAIKLYEKADFHQMGKRKNYYPTAIGNEDAVLMALTLGNPFA